MRGGLRADSSEIKYQAQALANFFEKAVLPAIPSEIRERVSSVRTPLVFTDEKFEGKQIHLLTRLEEASDGKWSPVIVINARLAFSAESWRSLAHEYFHAVHYWLRHPQGDFNGLAEDAWVTEGLATEFEARVMQEPDREMMSQYLQRPSRELMLASQGGAPLSLESYAHGYGYFKYLSDRCGGPIVLWQLAIGVPGESGARSIDSVIERVGAARPECASFADSALSFEIARVHGKSRESETAPGRFEIGRGWSSNLVAYRSADEVNQHAGLGSSWAAILPALRPYSPLVLEAEVDLPPSALQGIRVIWSQRVFPFAVQESAPIVRDRTWRQILIREPSEYKAQKLGS
ncbi:MAG TPA: hypothetical protein VM598_14700 [Bdellovibrionota bacterium]|nr:hypothetical protein [Bdellovibrionota bacterium]